MEGHAMPKSARAAKTAKMFGTAFVIMMFIVVTASLNREEHLSSNQATNFRRVFGRSPLDDKAQAAVDNYFEAMLKTVCPTADVHRQYPELERAQELAESLGFSVSPEYKRFRYGQQSCAGMGP